MCPSNRLRKTWFQPLFVTFFREMLIYTAKLGIIAGKSIQNQKPMEALIVVTRMGRIDGERAKAVF